MKELSQFLADEGMSQTKFAEIIGVDQSTVSNWIAGKAIPRRRTLLEISKVTAGRVLPHSWYSSSSPEVEGAPQ